jgi:hypothetical protein
MSDELYALTTIEWPVFNARGEPVLDAQNRQKTVVVAQGDKLPKNFPDEAHLRKRGAIGTKDDLEAVQRRERLEYERGVAQATAAGAEEAVRQIDREIRAGDRGSSSDTKS